MRRIEASWLLSPSSQRERYAFRDGLAATSPHAAGQAPMMKETRRAVFLRPSFETAASGGLLRMRVFSRQISILMVRSVALRRVSNHEAETMWPRKNRERTCTARNASTPAR